MGLLRTQLRRRAVQRLLALESELAPAAAVAAAGGLTPSSLALSTIRLQPQAPRVNLVLPNADLAAGYAGVGTAWACGSALAAEVGMPLRLVSLNPGSPALPHPRASADPFVEIVRREDLRHATFGVDDLWIATHWTTAHALAVATRHADIDVARCVYLVQDYEPGFVAWSTDYTVAESTYHAGFLTLVNSSPVADWLARHSGVKVDPRQVFAPELRLNDLRSAAERRSPSAPLRVSFYGRPSKPRNLYTLGVAALRIAADRAGTHDIDFVSMGEGITTTPLSRRSTLRSVGRLPLADYFDFLSTVDVVLSLQYSPHPSHPPLDAAISGALAVTNRFGEDRDSLHPRLLVADPAPEALADALSGAIDAARRGYDRDFQPLELGSLGAPMSSAVMRAAQLLNRSAG